ncbi:MAG: hypothetical protein J6V91_05905, partial [Kiritimatiellae bacterium]|nr:hypothetical protein [Kiritimatiellia bacterium]
MKKTWMKSFLTAGLKALPCTVLLTAVLAASHAQAAGESFSIGIDNGYGGPAYSGATQYGWTDARVAGDYWNNTDGNSITNLKMNDGIAVNNANFTITAKGGAWFYNGSAQLGGGTRDYFDGQWNFSLSGIPFSEYSVVLFMASDVSGKQWGPVKVTANGVETYYTYTSETVLTTTTATDLTPWGSTALASGYTAEAGVNVMVIPGCTGDISILTHGTSHGDALRGGLYALQVINTGTLEEYTVSGCPAMNYAYPVVFRGTTDATWDVVANWYTAETTISGSDVTYNWSAWTPVEGKNKAPGLSGSDAWAATLVDGSLMADTITVGSDGYKKISVAADYEGWASKVGIANNVHVEMANLVKLQADSDWRIDETSKLTVVAFGDGNKNGTHNVRCYAENGLVFKPDCGISFNYYLGTKGSVSFGGALSGTQTIKAIELDLGDSTKTGVELKTRKLIGFGSSTATFNVNGVVVTGLADEGATTVSVNAVTTPANVGDYILVEGEDGYYVNYAAYGDATVTTETVTMTESATLSSLGLTSGAMTIAEITVPNGATLTVDEALTFLELKLISTGTVKLAVGGTLTSLTDAFANVGTFTNAVKVLDIGALAMSGVTVPAESTLILENPAQVTSLTREAGSTLKITGTLSGAEGVLSLQNNTMVETSGTISVSGSVTETLQGRAWTLSDGAVTVETGFYLAAGAEWWASGNKSSLTIKNGATLTVEGAAATLGRAKTDGAMMFAECGNGSNVTVTGEGSKLAVPNGAINLSRDGASTATISDGAILQAYKLGGTSNSSTLTI